MNKTKEFIIESKRAPKLITVSLSIVTALLFIAPLIPTYFIIQSGSGFHFSLILIFLFFWLLAFYLTRLVLWNTYGREIITLEDNSIQYAADFRFFKDGNQKINPDNLMVSLIEYDRNNSLGVLLMESGKRRIQTVIKQPLEKREALKTEIEAFYKK